MAGFHYKLHTPEGDDIGEFNTIVPNWAVGETFTTGDGRVFRIGAERSPERMGQRDGA